MKAVFFILSIFLATAVQAQNNWPSPEVEQMYKQAREYKMQGNFQQAAITYKQAIALAPDKVVLYNDLAQVYYLTGAYDDALEILEPILKNNDGDEQSYQVKAASLSAKKEFKKAKSTLQEAIKKYPHAGILYHDLGKLYEDDGANVYALESWLDGIEADPAFHINYYEAARTYMGTKKPVWAVLYAEMFLNIEQHTPRADETRDMLLGAYMRLFSQLGTQNVPKYKNKKTAVAGTPNNFEEAVNLTYLKLSPVVSDGINTENLTMLRTRFLMEWKKTYANKYPFSLFTRLDDMVRSGYFDIYNEWVFGKIDNFKEFDIWNKFHPEAIPKLENWLKTHPYRPVGSDCYNNKEVDDIFIKEKKDDK
ncbi:MAG: hypothetical protein BGO70_14225 [Bacteroidetes bacterium 43-93]|nr:tetratricopeptide repeat protein [Bacteroidota bacterium]OJW99584.1 MAG: hypothetical protein BGO70_14225 [Bacteroidetes bacterium 43-93]